VVAAFGGYQVLARLGGNASGGLYLARKGEAVPSMPKKVRVTSLTFGEPLEGRLPFAISCSSGTYIRSIGSELGEKLGCGAHLETLRRTRIGEFRAEDAVTLERFEALSPAERMAAEVTWPLEEAVRAVLGVRNIRSTTSRGSAEISVGPPLVVNPGETCGWLSGRSTGVIVELTDLSAELIEFVRQEIPTI
jgi:tRNA U55 pseudouridine synthase TruB